MQLSPTGPAQATRAFDTLPAPSWRRRLVRGMQRVLHYSGAGLAYRLLKGARGATILMYHSVPRPPAAAFIDPANTLSPEVFEAHAARLARHRRVISMSALVEAITRGETLPAGTVILSFDDGYRDNLEVVAPVLGHHGLPAILYLATAYVSRGEAQWIDQLYRSFRYRTRERLCMDGGVEQPLAREADALAAYRALSRRLLPAGVEERRRVLADVERQLAPAVPAPRLTLDWDDVRRLRRDHPSFEVGVHTDEHLDLTSQDPLRAEGELRACMGCYERELGERPRHFSFPYGRHNDDLRKRVRGLGLASSVGAGDEILITARTDPFALTRVEAPSSRTLLSFYTSGSYPGVSRLLLGRA